MSEETGKLKLKLLQVIKSSQQQNGLRHRDYQRYRQYCARRLRRLRCNKVVDFKYGSGKGSFEQRVLTPEECVDDRFLLIPLVNAERAWAYAMHLKDENQREGEDPRKRLHLVRRLTKSVKWANKLRELCATVADDLSSLEAEAYCAWMTGNMLLEKDEWSDALVQFNLAKKVYEQLSTSNVSFDEKDLMADRVEEIEPAIRYCTYHLSRDGSSGSQEALKMLKKHGSAGGDLLQAKIRKVLEESRKDQSDQAASISWKGKQILVRSEKVRVALLEVKEQQEDLTRILDEAKNKKPEEGGENSKTSDLIESAFLEGFSTFDDAGRTIREERTRMLKAPSINVDKLTAEFVAILSYVKAIKLQKAVERNMLLAKELGDKFDEQEKRLSSITKNVSSPASQVQPEDLVRMYDRMSQHVVDLTELVCDGVEEAEFNPSQVKAQALICKSFRTFYIGWSLMSENKWPEALALFEYNQERLQRAEIDEDAVNEDTREALKSVRRKTKGAKCLALARSFKFRLESQKSAAVDPLVSSMSGLSVCDLPPTIEAVPCHPVVFDLAYSELDIGNIERGKDPKVDAGAQQQSGWLNSARGWFGRR